MTWKLETSQGHEAQKIKFHTVPYTRGFGLDIGCGPQRIWPTALGIDRYVHPYGASVVADVRSLPFMADKSADYVFSSHVLEDFKAEESVKILKEWWRVIKPGGYLLLYLPHEDLYPKVGEYGANPDHQQNLNPDCVIDYMREIRSGWTLVENETRGSGNEYSFFQVYQKRMDGKQELKLQQRLNKRCVVIRYGGFGDMIQAASIFDAIKEDGYELWVNTTPHGQEVIKTDPRIDGWILQDRDQVPNHELTDYFRSLGERFDKVINLCESVEGSLLKFPGRPEYNWSQERLREVCDVNYVENIHRIAGYSDAKPNPRFMPTRLEREWAIKERRKIPGVCILWSLSGSSIHKAYPHMDQVIARMLFLHKTVHFVTVGDGACTILEYAWTDSERVHCKANKWTIRETLAFAQQADVVVGPETGVLNSVGHDDVAKVLMLSHSSVNNLCRDWKNTTALMPVNVDCYPCHKLHYGGAYCNLEDETHAAMCQFDIEPGRVVEAIETKLNELSSTMSNGTA